MSAIIPGYEYDIFISYRQKDNKYDGWVTEFIDNLRKELEATFKDEIIIYFDLNPHDGILETYNVDASVKQKLKSLIFIPVISQTYCDTRSFAWQNELMMFNKMAQEDSLGRDIKLSNGNVALLGFVAGAYDYDWKDAAEEFRISMDAGPELPEIRIRYTSCYLCPLGRFEEVIIEEEKELELDPLNIISRVIQSHHLSLAGKYDRALEVAQKALEHDENHWFVHSIMAEIFVGMGKFEEALNSVEKSYRMAPWDTRTLGLLAGLLSRGVDSERAQQIKDQLYTMAMGSIGLLLYNLLISDIEAAADCFQQAIEQRELLVVIYVRSQLLAPLRSNKRWAQLAGMMNLPGHIAEVTRTG